MFSSIHKRFTKRMMFETEDLFNLYLLSVPFRKLSVDYVVVYVPKEISVTYLSERSQYFRSFSGEY